MKVTIATVCLALATSVAASVSTREQKPIIVSYPHDTPDGVIAEAKAMILKAGGLITHEFNLIKGFAAEASANTLEAIQALDAHNNVMIEEDKVVKVASS